MRARGVRVVAFQPPYHPAMWEFITHNARYAEPLATIDAWLGRLAERVGVRYANYSDPATVPCSEEEFFDGSHARATCLERVVRRALR